MTHQTSYPLSPNLVEDLMSPSMLKYQLICPPFLVAFRPYRQFRRGCHHHGRSRCSYTRGLHNDKSSLT